MSAKSNKSTKALSKSLIVLMNFCTSPGPFGERWTIPFLLLWKHLMYDTQYWKTTEVSLKELIPESQLNDSHQTARAAM